MSTYAVDDTVSCDGKLWVCISEITAAGDWTGAANWATSELSLSGSIAQSVNIVVPDGDFLSDMLVISPGEYSEFYFSMTSFNINSLPTYKIAKQVVDLMA